MSRDSSMRIKAKFIDRCSAKLQPELLKTNAYRRYCIYVPYNNSCLRRLSYTYVEHVFMCDIDRHFVNGLEVMSLVQTWSTQKKL